MLDQDPALPTALVDFPPPPEAPQGARQRWRFDRPSRWLVAHDPSQVAGLLDAAHALAQAGQWCVGWVAYEAAPGLNPHLPVKALPPGQPYAVWAVFDQAQAWDGQPVTDSPASTATGADNPSPALRTLRSDGMRWHCGFIVNAPAAPGKLMVGSSLSPHPCGRVMRGGLPC